MLIGECNGEKLVPDFKTDNASLRFFSLSNAITEGLLKNKKILPADTGKRDILSEYNDLVLKNIAVTLYQKNNCSDTSITLSYNLLDFPSLSEVRKGATKKYQLIKMQTLQYSLQQK